MGIVSCPSALSFLISSEPICSSILSVCFGVGTLLLMQLGRALTALAMGTDFQTCLGFFTTDALSLLFTGLIIWIARRLDGIFENQRHYLLRIHNTEEEKGGF